MARRQIGNLFGPAAEVRIAADEERSGPLLDQACEGRVDLAFGAGSQHDELQPERARRSLGLIQFQLGIRIVRVHQHGDDRGVGNELVQQLQSLRREQIGEESDARDIAARPVEARDKSVLDRVAAETEDDRDRCGRRLGRERRDRSDCGDHGHLTADQIGRQRRQPIILPIGRAEFDRHVPALDEAGFAQALAECGQCLRAPRGRGVEEPDHRHRRLLRARGAAATPPPRRRGA